MIEKSIGPPLPQGRTTTQVVVSAPPRSRACLRCAQLFQSAGPGERICPRCKGSKAWRDGMPLTSTQAAKAERSRRRG